jgi:hypothetical protein
VAVGIAGDDVDVAAAVGVVDAGTADCDATGAA